MSSPSPASPPTTNPLKRPAPISHESSESSVQIISSIEPHSATSTTTPTTNTTKTETTGSIKQKPITSPSTPVAKKPKIALVPGGAGSGGQTKLAFGPVGGGGAGTGGNTTKTTKPTTTGNSSKSTNSTAVSGPAPPSLLSALSTSSSALRTHLLLPIPSLPPSPTPSDLTAHIAALRQIKSDFLALLTEDQRGLLGMEVDWMGDDWFVGLRGEFIKPYFMELKRFIIKEQEKHKVFPPAPDVYSWTQFCPLAGIRVVIIGQDPYHNDGQAHGLAFSVRKGTAVPPSLRNMYKELENEYPGKFKAPKHGDLSSWARQGVLLLNTSLTVRAHEANSHSKHGWETFTERVLKLIVDRLSSGGAEVGAKGVCFLAWGAGAGKLVKGISERNHHILTSAHPSPLSASRGFLGNGHFVNCSEWLVERYGEGKGIDWTSVMEDKD